MQDNHAGFTQFISMRDSFSFNQKEKKAEFHLAVVIKRVAPFIPK